MCHDPTKRALPYASIHMALCLCLCICISNTILFAKAFFVFFFSLFLSPLAYQFIVESSANRIHWKWCQIEKKSIDLIWCAVLWFIYKYFFFFVFYSIQIDNYGFSISLCLKMLFFFFLFSKYEFNWHTDMRWVIGMKYM